MNSLAATTFIALAFALGPAIASTLIKPDDTPDRTKTAVVAALSPDAGNDVN